MINYSCCEKADPQHSYKAPTFPYDFQSSDGLWLKNDCRCNLRFSINVMESDFRIIYLKKYAWCGTHYIHFDYAFVFPYHRIQTLNKNIEKRIRMAIHTLFPWGTSSKRCKRHANKAIGTVAVHIVHFHTIKREM